MTDKFTQWNPDSRKTNRAQDGSKVPTDPRTLNKGNETRFRLSDVPTQSKRKFRRLTKHHHDVAQYRDDINMSANADADFRKEMMASLGYQLGVGDRTRYRATRKLFEIDAGRTGYPLPVIGFCLYVYFFDEETKAYESRTQSRYWESNPGEERIYWPLAGRDNDEAFQRVADNLKKFYTNVSRGGIQRILQKLEDDNLPTRKKPKTPMKREVV